MAWPRVRLGEVLRRVERFEARDELTEYQFAGTYSFARGIFVGQRKLGSTFALPKIQRIHQGDFIYCKIMAWEGAFGIAPKEVDRCVMSGAFVAYELNRDRIDQEFLDYFFKVPAHWQAIGNQSSGTNVRRQSLHPTQFERAEIPLPPLAEQRRIVARIEALAAKIAETRSLRQLEEQEIRTMQRGAFVRIAKHALRRPMSEVAPLIRRPVEIEMEGSYPELGIRSFGNGTFHKAALSGFELGSKRVFWIEPGDLLFSNVFAWEGAIAVAKPEDRGRVGSHRFITCAPRKDVTTSQFLRFYFLTDEGMDLIRAASPGGAGRNRTLGLAALDAIEVPVPPIEDQLWFDNLQAKVDALKRLQGETATELDAMLPAILDRAFRGKL